MIELFKEALAPSIASFGVMQYWKGNYELSVRRLLQARSWSPWVFENSIYQGYLGLGLYKSGNIDQSKEHIESIWKYLSTTEESDQDINDLYEDLYLEIKDIISAINT